MLDRVPTGISGLDAIIEGGLPKGRNYILTGNAGSGKTILASQYLYNGAYKFSEKGLYISFEETVEDILENLSRFDWNLKPYLEDESLKFQYIPFIKEKFEDNLFKMLTEITKEVKEKQYKRLVIDSIPAMGFFSKDQNQLRKDLYYMLHEIRKIGCTTILISEKSSGEIGLTRFGIEDFLTHGLLMMHLSHTYRGIEIRKMRGTNHTTDIHRLRISDVGITVYTGDHPY